MAAHLAEKLHLSARGLIKKARNVFKNVKEPLKGSQGKQREISIADCLSSALAIFKLKFPSLLQFEGALTDKHTRQNIKNLFGLENVPCDTYMRERLDEINPRDIRLAFTKVFSTLQRGKQLEKFTFLDGIPNSPQESVFDGVSLPLHLSLPAYRVGGAPEGPDLSQNRTYGSVYGSSC